MGGRVNFATRPFDSTQPALRINCKEGSFFGRPRSISAAVAIVVGGVDGGGKRRRVHFKKWNGVVAVVVTLIGCCRR